MLTDLLLAAGPAAGALAALQRAALPAPCQALAERLAEVAALLAARAPTLKITIDPLEFRGFRYHTGIAVTVFAPGRHEELGRGGRYISANGEPATGITLYADAILRAAPTQPGRAKIYLPLGTDPALAKTLRQSSYATIAALDPIPDPMAEARRLHCTHVLLNGTPTPAS